MASFLQPFTFNVNIMNLCLRGHLQNKHVFTLWPRSSFSVRVTLPDTGAPSGNRRNRKHLITSSAPLRLIILCSLKLIHELLKRSVAMKAILEKYTHWGWGGGGESTRGKEVESGRRRQTKPDAIIHSFDSYCPKI